MLEVIGIDHIYITVSDIETSETFYDALMGVLGFRKKQFQLSGEKHVHYYNRHFGYILRPARTSQTHDAYAPGLHHLCLRVEDRNDVEEAAARLKEQNVSVSAPRLYPEYAADYVAIYLADPDGLRLEITNYRQECRQRHHDWRTL